MLLEPFLARYPKIPYGYLLELKYFKRKEMTEAAKQKAIADATDQLQQYLQVRA